MKMDIEQLAREALLPDSQQPPAAAWEAIARNLDAPAPVPRRKRPYVWAAAAALLLGGTAAALLMRPQEAEEEVAMIQEETPEVAAAVAVEAPAHVPTLSERTLVSSQSRPAASRPAATPKPASQMAALPSDVAPQAPAARTTPAPAPEPQPTVTPQAPQPSQPAPAPQLAQATPSTPQTQQSSTPKDTLNQPIPNFISPNGDGENDCFVIPGAERYTRITLEIYNSRSQRVFKTSQYENNFCGDALPEGNYFYVIRFYLPDHSSHLRRGVVVLKR